MPSCILFLPTVTMDISETREYVRATLRHESEPLWFPQLAGPIGRVAWNRLSRQIGLTSKSYSTTRLVLRDPEAKHHIVRYCGPKSGQGRDRMPGLIPVEVLTADVMQKITDHDVRLLQPHLLQGSVAAGLDAAFSLLELVPTIGATIHELVKALHVIDSCDDDTDVSFSDPALPFSVFVSVPRRKSVTVSWRIAEAILHESMHLHLTLVGQVLPSASYATKRVLLPLAPRAKERGRHSSGIICIRCHPVFLYRAPDLAVKCREQPCCQ